jgi:hypothetical protein
MNETTTNTNNEETNTNNEEKNLNLDRIETIVGIILIIVAIYFFTHQ